MDDNHRLGACVRMGQELIEAEVAMHATVAHLANGGVGASASICTSPTRLTRVVNRVAPLLSMVNNADLLAVMAS